MSTAQTLLFGAIAGLTIFVGLPLGRMQNVSPATKAFLAATATGVLIFLFWDVLSHAVGPVETALKEGRGGRFAWLAFLLTAGFFAGLMSLVYYDTWMKRRRRRPDQSRDRADHRLRPAQCHRRSRDLRAARRRQGAAELGLPRRARAHRRRADVPRDARRAVLGQRGCVDPLLRTRRRLDPLRRDGAPERRARPRIEDARHVGRPVRPLPRLQHGLHPRSGRGVGADSSR